MSNHQPQLYRFFLMTIDPVHIGTGGYRLGRVDNTIVREPGTRVPKIPGTAIHGAIRHYAAHRLGKPQCAGQSGHCGKDICPICYTFGAITEDGARAGVVSISDAHILLFPVYSMYGPVWVTTCERLRDSQLVNNPPKPSDDKAIWSDDLTPEGSINLGWLMVERDVNESFDPATIQDNGLIQQEIKNRIVIVSERLFTHIVNSNLEVRTSVSIDPETGAAQEGALFTYEAIPRATILWTDVVVSDFKGNFPDTNRWKNILARYGLHGNPEQWPSLPENVPSNEASLNEEEKKVLSVLRELGYVSAFPEQDVKKKEFWNTVKQSYNLMKKVIEGKFPHWRTTLDMVHWGFQWTEYLGIGGMGTRGFGRIKNRGCVHVPIDTASQAEGCKDSQKSRNDE